MSNVATIGNKFRKLSLVMDERMRRLWAASEARAIGWGGISLVAEATGLSRPTITAGLQELNEREKGSGVLIVPAGRIRRAGGGRKPLIEQDRTLLDDLTTLVEPATRGDPTSPLRWCSKSLRKLASELNRATPRISHTTVGRLLQGLDYSLQANRKTKEGASHADRDAQFEYIQEQTGAFKRRGQPAISVDTKKKELVGDFKNGGREWHRQGEPERARVHDFEDKKLGKAIPYGVYDVLANTGWASIGMHHDTAEFAMEAIRRWWHYMGRPIYGAAHDLLITADGGGSNSSRSRLWKVCLQKLADSTRLHIRMCHYPPGTSKWNKIEHRLFAPITQNWRSRPLFSVEAIISLISHTSTQTGLKIMAQLDTTPIKRVSG